MNLKTTFKNYIVFSYILIGFVCCNRNYNDEKKFNDFVESFNSKSDNLSFNVNRLSEDVILQQLSETKDKLKTLRKIDIKTLDKESQIDYKFIESILVGEEIENEEIQSWKKDPRDYMNFRQISTTINGPKNCEDKINYLIKYLPVVKSDLNLGISQLESYVPRFQELGLYMAKNSNSIFIDEINNLFVSCNSSSETNKKTILKLSSEIIEALNVFINFLEIDLPNKQKSSFSIGKETYNKMLKNQFLLDYTDETLWEFGWKEFNNTLDKMDELAKDINPDKTTQEILVDIKNEYPHPDSMIQAHQYWVDKSGEHIKLNKLIPIPWKERVNVVPREEYLRTTSY